MASLKLKFKIKILNDLSSLNILNLEDSSFTSTKSKTVKTNPKINVRKGEPNLHDYESLPGYEKESTLLNFEEKEDLLNFMKTINFSILSKIFSIINENKFYLRLKTKQGLEIVRKLFEQILNHKTKMMNNESEYINMEESLMLSDECELYIFLQEFLFLSELDAMDLYDLFKYNEFFAVTEQNFLMLILLLASYECGQLEDYIQSFAQEIFNCLSGNEKVVSLSRLKEVGRVLGFDENVLSKLCTEMNLELNSLIDQEIFKKFYTSLGRVYDEHFKSENYLQESGRNKKSQDKAKTTGCMNKACNIL
jgi:hypothetical protein